MEECGLRIASIIIQFKFFKKQLQFSIKN
jgi:hypothetical protein